MRRALRGLVLVLAAALLAFAAVLGFNTWRFSQQALQPKGVPPTQVVDSGAVARLATAVRFRTVSGAGRIDETAFAGLHAHLQTSFPRVHATLRREIVAGHSLLYTWPGRDASLPPLVLTGHLDVVPVEPGTEARWTHPPFSGAVADGFIWGRGTLDDKVGVLGLLEAVERKLAAGYRPRRTVYLAFGHDEEIAGTGAQAMAALLKARGVRPLMVLDEGQAVVRGVLPVAPPVALVGVAEKGYLSVELTTRGSGGHSSMPPDGGSVPRLARALQRLNDTPFPPRLIAPIAATLERTGPYMPLGRRIALANLWLAEGLVTRGLLAAPSTAAAVRTTTAMTVLTAGTKDNVLPQSARAVVNHRLLPGDRISDVMAFDRSVIDDPAVEMRPLPVKHEATPVSPTEGPAFAMVERAAERVFPEAIVAPSLTLGATDARRYVGLTGAVYRFLPVPLEADDLSRIHGTNERVRATDYMRAIAFYGALIDEAAGN